jgi:hypothetical protein
MVDERGVYHPKFPIPSSRASHALRLVTMLDVAMIPLIAVAERGTRADPRKATVIAPDAIHLRECPSLGCRIVRSVPLGSNLNVTGEQIDGFVPVRSDDRAGWARHLFLSHQWERPLLRQGWEGCSRVATLATFVETRIPVSMFAMGWWAEAFSEYLQQLARYTRAMIGSHGNTQTCLTGVSNAKVLAEICDDARRIENVLGYPAGRYYTANAQDTGAPVERLITEEGYLAVRWTVSAADYHNDDTAAELHGQV